MVVIILGSLLIAAVAFFQALQGTFSALIMTVLTVVCSVVALNFYEPAAQALIGRLGAYAHGVCLLALFVVPLLALRELFDRLVRGNVILGLWIDRIGGAVLGAVTGLLLVGMLMIVVQLLPLPGKFLTYRPYDSTLQPDQGGPPRFAADFTLGLAGHLSGGSMRPIGGGRDFDRVHDDLQLEAFCIRNRPPRAMAWAPADALEVLGAWKVRPVEGPRSPTMYSEEEMARDTIASAPKYPLLEPTAKTDVLVIRTRVMEMPPKDATVWVYQLPATHFRLVTEGGRSFYPVDYLTYAGTWRLNAEVDDKGRPKIAELVVVRDWSPEGGPKKLTVDWVYRIPRKKEGQQEDKPQAVVFRGCSWARLTEILEALPRPVDEKGRQVALDVKPVTGHVEFAKPRIEMARLLRPKALVADEQFSDFVNVRVDPAGMPPGLTLELSQDAKLRRASYAGPAKPLVIIGRSMSVRAPSQFHPPSSRHVVVQVRCEVDKSFPVNASYRAQLRMMQPQLLLSNALPVAHRGAILTYQGPQDRQVTMYYDAEQPAKQADARLVGALLDNVAQVEHLVFVFAVAGGENRTVVGFSLGIGRDYEFHAPRPLAVARP